MESETQSVPQSGALMANGGEVLLKALSHYYRMVHYVSNGFLFLCVNECL